MIGFEIESENTLDHVQQPAGPDSGGGGIVGCQASCEAYGSEIKVTNLKDFFGLLATYELKKDCGC